MAADQDTSGPGALWDYPPMPAPPELASGAGHRRSRWLYLSRGEWVAVVITGVACVAGVVYRGLW